MGREVYHARDSKRGHDVTKSRRRRKYRLPKAVAHDPERLARFEREVQLLASLSHPNIATIYGWEVSGGVLWLEMERVPGETLAERIARGGPLPLEEALTICRQIADALDYVHQQDIVHRDIKPANIMVLKDGTVKVTDFGIARITASSKTQTGVVMGTPSYMSPEQLIGKKVDGRSDLFSLTVVLYEMLTCQKPFEAESAASLIYKIANEAPPPPTVYNESIHPEVIRIIERGMEKDLEKRYQRGGEMAADLRSAIPLVEKALTASRTSVSQKKHPVQPYKEQAYPKGMPAEEEFDIDAPLVAPPMSVQRIKVRIRWMGRETPRIAFDPERD